MLSIDEAIAHARDVANEQKRRSGICIQNDSECDKFSDCLKCAEEHEQLAEWLEELKDMRNLDKTNFSNGYNRAIDDFLKEADLTFHMQNDGTVVIRRLENIAKQVKRRWLL